MIEDIILEEAGELCKLLLLLLNVEYYVD